MAYTEIDNPELYFQTLIWSGNDVGTSRAFTFDGDEDMQPDLVWTKIRTGWAAKHNLWDSVRGVNKNISSDATTTETTTDQYGYVSSFDSDGFTGSNGSNVYNPRYLYNENGGTYVAWCWKETADAGFDIVGYTGNATDDVDISHSLSAVPHVIIVKNRDNTNNENWCVYHHKNTSAPETDFLKLNTSDATADEVEIWSDEVPTSSVFTIGRQDAINTSSGNHIAYLWSEKQGYSKFGSYTGNGNIDGDFVYTGFRPAWLMIKGPSQTQSWIMLDTKRSPHNVIGEDELLANTTEATGAASWNPNTSNAIMDILSNGFKIRTTQTTGLNTSGEPYIYMAFAEAPFVNSNGVPCNAR